MSQPCVPVISRLWFRSWFRPLFPTGQCTGVREVLWGPRRETKAQIVTMAWSPLVNFRWHQIVWHRVHVTRGKIRVEGCIELHIRSQHAPKKIQNMSRGPREAINTGRRRPPFDGTALAKAGGISPATWMFFQSHSILPTRHVRRLKYPPRTMRHHRCRLAGLLPLLARNKRLTSHGMDAFESVEFQPRSTLLQFGVRARSRKSRFFRRQKEGAESSVLKYRRRTIGFDGRSGAGRKMILDRARNSLWTEPRASSVGEPHRQARTLSDVPKKRDVCGMYLT